MACIDSFTVFIMFFIRRLGSYNLTGKRNLRLDVSHKNLVSTCREINCKQSFIYQSFVINDFVIHSVAMYSDVFSTLIKDGILV